MQSNSNNGVNNWDHRFLQRWQLIKSTNTLKSTWWSKGPAPYNLTIQKGMPQVRLYLLLFMTVKYKRRSENNVKEESY